MKKSLNKVSEFIKQQMRVFAGNDEIWAVRRDGRFGIIYSEEGLGEVHLEGELLPLSGSWFLNVSSIKGGQFTSGMVVDGQKASEISERVQLYFKRKKIVLHLAID
jgi:hypothetical protein